MKHYACESKYKPLVEEVQLLEVNPQYTHIRFPDGREDAMLLKHLPPLNNRFGSGSNINTRDKDLKLNQEKKSNVHRGDKIKQKSPRRGLS